jgi:hypothetical protein
MFSLFNWAKSIFATENYQTEIERFIVSKNPKSIAEIDYWAREYTYNLKRGSYIC